MATDPQGFMDAVDSFLGSVEASKLVTTQELESVRKEMVADLKREGRRTVNSLQTAKVGSAKILVPNSSNLRKINLSTERSRTRLSKFRLSYLDRSQVAALAGDGKTLNTDPSKFIRHSRRMARHAREFLGQIKELDPSLAEEVDATLLQLEDNDLDLLKLEVKSFTRLKETMLRGVQGRKERGEVLKEIDDFDINRNLFNLSLTEHPDAVVRDLLAQASGRMVETDPLRAITKLSDIPKRAHVFVGIPPDAAARMGPTSRTADIAFRLFDQNSLNEKFKSLPGTQASKGGWRGLGLGFNTKEWYLPVPPSLVTGVAGEELLALASARRAAVLGGAEEVTLADAAATPKEKKKRKPRKPRKKVWKETDDLAVAQAQLKTLTGARKGKITIDLALDRDVALEALNEVGKAHADLLNRYPGLANFRSAKTKPLWELRFGESGNSSNSNGTYWNSRRKIHLKVGSGRTINATAAARKSRPPTIGTLGGSRKWGISQGATDTYRHEFGHAIQYRLPDAKWEEWQALYNSKRATNAGWWKDNVSTYSDTNHKEAFAESFSYYTNPRKAADAPPLPPEIEAFLRSILLA